MNQLEIIQEWKKGCTHCGPRAGTPEGRAQYVGGCEECTEPMIAALLEAYTEQLQTQLNLLNHLSTVKRVILDYLDADGDPARKITVLRRLAQVAGERS